MSVEIDGKTYEMDSRYILTFGRGAFVICNTAEAATEQIGRWLNAPPIDVEITVRVVQAAMVEVSS